MQIIFKKNADRPSSMRCVRDDGTETWIASPTVGEFFIEHDLLHYSVETVLGISSAFFGMVSGGRDLDDFGTKEGVPDVMDEKAYWVEKVVGTIQRGYEIPEGISVADLEKITNTWDQLRAEWAVLKPDEIMTLPFPVPL